ncbi:hypothetical protein DYBT9275_01825 [Dyadobacter sp. CECT 9275]|uniref:HTH araC/xylS-type domain-containing protein n=1 Tax=Dyadobacter helix TaxID=2822344 RepID=A0A916JAZ1_9BACT|nr:helix-turn-helix transcriptional regulator [Dyadobacter sp. CECT 9275]CAG4997655.1 hypothetical protein DYBT9275_01825 [Dyadobacter sp. CECT 9275]
MNHQEFDPPENLRDTIKCFWYDKKEFGEEQSLFEVVPDGFAEIIFHFGSGCSVVREGILQPLPSPFMMGILNKPAQFYTKNSLELVGVRCYPWTVFDLLELPADKQELRTFTHPISRLQGTLAELIREGKVEETVARLEAYSLELRSQISTDSMLFKAGMAMRQASGTLPVAQVAAAAHTTVRTLERRFRESSGHTVKDVSSLLRFEQARNYLWLHPNTNLAGLAHELGYSDQSHLSREFKRYSGTTPAVFAKNADKLAMNDLLATFVNS